MEKVEPIRDPKKVKAILNILKGEESWRDYILFITGINFGLRIGDLLKLQVRNVKNDNGEIKDSFEITEQKTGKKNGIEINGAAKKALELFFNKTDIGNDFDNYLIYNTQTYPVGSKSISRVQAYRIVKKRCKQVGLVNLNIGAITLRKTFGYHAWKKGIPIETIQKKFKHDSTSTTRRYLGIEPKDVKEAYNTLNGLFE